MRAMIYVRVFKFDSITDMYFILWMDQLIDPIDLTRCTKDIDAAREHTLLKRKYSILPE